MTTALVTFNSFDASILTGSLRDSSMRMYERDFKAFVEFAGSVEVTLDLPRLHVGELTYP